MNKAASELAKLRWAKVPQELRGQEVGHAGGRPLGAKDKQPRKKRQAKPVQNSVSD